MFLKHVSNLLSNVQDDKKNKKNTEVFNIARAVCYYSTRSRTRVDDVDATRVLASLLSAENFEYVVSVRLTRFECLRVNRPVEFLFLSFSTDPMSIVYMYYVYCRTTWKFIGSVQQGITLAVNRHSNINTLSVQIILALVLH
jgi:hypothetical protein